MKSARSILLLMLSVIFMYSCNSDTAKFNETTDAPETSASETGFSLDGITIVCGEYALDSEFKAAVYLCDVIEAMTGARPKLTNDYDRGEDNTARHEILVGTTNRAESIASAGEIDELEYTIRAYENKIVIVGKSPRITYYASELFAKEYLGYSPKKDYSETSSLTVPRELSEVGSYYDALRLGKIIKFNLADNGTEARPDSDVSPANFPERAGIDEGAYYTDRTLTIERDSIKHGGAQFIAKLFTEGLSRAPLGKEFAEFTRIIEEKGCTVETLTELSIKLFSDKKFAECGLNDTEVAFAVTRAILNRDPTSDEIMASSGIPAVELAKKLCATDEFASMLPDIVAGPYFRGKNSTSAYTGGSVMTADELQAMLNSNSIVSLAQGTLVLVDKNIVIPDNVILETEGNPTHYTKMARLIRVGGGDYDMIHVRTKSTVRNIFVDGNFNHEDERIAGTNIMCISNGGSVIGCRCSDSGCTYAMNILCGTEHNYVGYNLITCYASDHNRTWQDGLRCMGTDCLLEYNEVVDATDAAIAVFRYVANIDGDPGANSYIRAQNSIVRYNTIFQAGNSSYASLDYESNNINWNDTKLEGSDLNIPENPANFTGFAMYENRIFTSLKAHTHLLITMSTQPWTKDGETDRVFGGSVYNNYTPEGCHICCAAGIVSDMNTDCAVRGNSFELYIGDWCALSGDRVPRIYSIDESDCKGDYQSGYIDSRISDTSGTFIMPHLPIETADSFTLREAVLHEKPAVIPKERFESK